MFGENYNWNYDYVRLACDSDFSFQRYPANSFDKNKICLLDVEQIIQEKDVAAVEKFISYVCQFVLDPEQAQILDDNFVKVFRLSQLVIDYLLFCKKYLDKTLNEVKNEIDKTKKENRELQLFVDDLQKHIAVLTKDIKDLSEHTLLYFTCEHCSKKFSTEEFLNSHIKRRHIIISPLDLETNKLHMEIKELKGRLNSTEKLIQQEQNHLKPVQDVESDTRINELKKIDELQQKFEDLRVQVQSELKVLQTQYNFQEKYEKLFEKITIQNLNRQVDNKNETRVLERRRETTTQTEKEDTYQELNKEMEVKNNTEQQITELKEALEVKVSTSLEKIENQMQSFWNKLHEMERPTASGQNIENQEPPSIKPRSKYTVKGSLPVEKKVLEELALNENEISEIKTQNISDNIQHINKKLNKQVDKEQQPITIMKNKQQSPVKEKKTGNDVLSGRNVKTKLQMKEHNTEKIRSSATNLSDSEIETVVLSETSEKIIKNEHQSKSSKPVVKKSSKRCSLKKLEVNAELFDHFKEEVENIMVMGRLQDLGVSPEWKGLPTRSFQRALEIVNHKANLMKKTYPNFDQISAQIEMEVNKKAELFVKEKNEKNILKETSDTERKKVVSVIKKRNVSQQIEIQNRKIYNTDSDTESAKITKVKDLKELSAPYFAVIQELKTVTTKFDQSVLDANSVHDEMVTNEETKGVLKNFHSAGSLTKKKVLFNLYNNENFETKNKEGESTTSITSSILDGSPKKLKREANVKEKDIEDLSDFDFSDV